MSRHYRFTSVLLALLFALSFSAPSKAFTPPSALYDAEYDPTDIKGGTSSLNPLRNQGVDNVSYAFVTAALAEIALDHKSADYNEDLSEQYMRYALSKGTKDDPNAFGYTQEYNAAFSNSDIGRSAIAAFLTRGAAGGLVVEEEDPYIAAAGARAASVTTSQRPIYRIGDVIFLSDIQPPKGDEADRAARIYELKSAIAKYGAVGGWIYSSRTTTTASASTSYWFNDYLLYNYSSANPSPANWCVALVGWDDNYDYGNDKGNGAFIVRNSWGSVHGGKDKKTGYFYLAYQDYYLLKSAFAVDNPIHLGDEAVDATYEHDPFGMTAEYEVAGSAGYSWAANVFSVTESEQIAKYVSFAVSDAVEDYDVYIKTLEEGETVTDALSVLGDAQKVDVEKKAVANSGYYTAAINGGVNLGAEGSTVLVAVKIKETPKVPVEQKSSTNNATAETGQSYVSADGLSWNDISKDGSNACIKLLVENSTLDRPVSVTLSAKNLEIKLDDPVAGKTAQLTAAVSGENGLTPDQSVIWSSSDNSIASVSSDGTVTAKKAGECVITARTVVGAKKDTCAVSVPNIEVTSVTVTPETLTLKTNAQAALSAKCLPSNASSLALVWTVDDDSVATVSSVGVVKALAPGTAVITAESEISKGVLDTCVVTVEQDYVSSVSLDKKSLRLSVGSSIPINVITAPVTAYDKSVTWTMIPEDSDVAAIQDNIITAIKPGNVTFVATVNTPKPGTAALFAQIEVAVVEGVDVYCTVGKKIKITSTLKVSDPSKLEWKAYNVVDGEVAGEASPTSIELKPNKLSCSIDGKAIGEYRIEIKDPDNEGNTQIIRVGVKKPVTKVITYLEGDEVRKKIRRTELTVDQDGGNPGSIQLYSSTVPEDATYSDVTWKSNKPNIATVSSTGVVTAVAPGSATISCFSNSDNKKANFSVSVKYNSKTLTLSKPGPLLIDMGRTASIKANLEKIRNISKVIVWSSEDESVATVNKSGRIKAEGIGTTTITARTLGGLEESIEIVSAVLPRSVAVNSKKLQLKPNGEGAKIQATISPGNATETELTYESRDSTIASVDSEGNVTPGRTGSTTITITTNNKKKARVSVVVK